MNKAGGGSFYPTGSDGKRKVAGLGCARHRLLSATIYGGMKIQTTERR